MSDAERTFATLKVGELFTLGSYGDLRCKIFAYHGLNNVNLDYGVLSRLDDDDVVVPQVVTYTETGRRT